MARGGKGGFLLEMLGAPPEGVPSAGSGPAWTVQPVPQVQPVSSINGH